MDTFFYSISDILHIDTISLKEMIYGHIQRSIYCNNINNTYLIYQTYEKNVYAWGSKELQAICNIWGVRVLVHSNLENIHSVVIILPSYPHHVTKTIQLQWYGYGYWPVFGNYIFNL